MRPQLQSGHWYFVHDGDGCGSIRSYMHDGWYPPNPHPVNVICEMSRSPHPDNVDVDDNFVVHELEQIIIAHYCPAAANRPLAVRMIRAQAERLCLAAGKDWDRTWFDQWDPENKSSNHHVAFLTIAAAFTRQCVGDTPIVRDWNEMIEKQGPPDGLFRPRRWPAEEIPGALVLKAS